jgi:hypothetical protein
MNECCPTCGRPAARRVVGTDPLPLDGLAGMLRTPFRVAGFVVATRADLLCLLLGPVAGTIVARLKVERLEPLDAELDGSDAPGR